LRNIASASYEMAMPSIIRMLYYIKRPRARVGSCEVMVFTDRFMPLNVRKNERLEQLVKRTQNLPFMATDCALPMLHALENRLRVNTFVIYTDNETWAGAIHADEALRRYREWSGIDAKLVVAGVTSTGFTLADPNDAGMLDVVGFDSATPNLIADFVRD
jgi:60 kDa SS-A/Ro ribonucleoprotein